MILTLTVLRCPSVVAPETRQVTGGDFSIGRGPDNTWVLADPDKQVSKRHCVIAFRTGAWRVAGTSTNGTFINRDEEPLESRAPQTLRDGDRLRLGAYEIEVRLVEDARSTAGERGYGNAGKPNPFADPFADDPFGAKPFSAEPAAEPGASLNPFSAALAPGFDPLMPDKEEKFTGPTRPDHRAAISDAINLPPVTSVLPDDWDLDAIVSPPGKSRRLAAAAAVPVPPEPSQAPVSRDADSGNLLEAFLRGAGMEHARPPDPARTMEQIGAAFRAFVSGIRHVLIARAGTKREFRIEATQIRTHGNNLLKFSANDDDALAGLLGVGRRTDMPPEEAVADALADIRLQEIATMAAMQDAVRALVVRLGPDQLRDAADHGGGLARLGNRKARAWDSYEVLHAEVLRGLSDDFDSVFGKRFARSYEQAIQELLARRRHQRDDHR